MIKRFSVAFFCLVMLAPALCQGSDPCIELFSPQGLVKAVRQVTARFSEPLVRFGDPRLPDPFDITCSEKGKGRWVDGSNWVYDFDRDLPAGLVCKFRLKQEVKTLSGKWIGGAKEFSFSTGGASIVNSVPYESRYANISEDQIFILILDTEPVEASILASCYFTAEKIQERIGVRLIEGAQRDEILKQSPYKYLSQDLKSKPLILLQAKQNFPAKAKVRLVWGKGIRSKSGVATGADQVLAFKTREPFSATWSCERENADADCIPFLPVLVQFSSSVPWEKARSIVLRGSAKEFRPVEPRGEEKEFVDSIEFPVPLPEKARFTLEMPDGFADDAGRGLVNRKKFPAEVKTAGYPPLAKFSSRFGIIEQADPVLPVTLRSIEAGVTGRRLAAGMLEGSVSGRSERITDEKEMISWLQKMATTDRRHSLLKDKPAAQSFTLPKPGGAQAFEVIGIPLENKGLHIVELESAILGAALLGEPKPMYVPTAALVTNLSAHFKWGRQSSIVWVTTLDKAEPVAGAAVTIRDCAGAVLWQGVTDKKGVAYIAQQLPEQPQSCPLNEEAETYWDRPQMEALDGMGGGLFVCVKAEDDMTFVHSSWEQGIEPWRFRFDDAESYGADPVRAHSVFDRSLFRAGETVHMKHIIRSHSMEGFACIDPDKLPKVVVIEHLGSRETYELPLAWDIKAGIAETTWTIPKKARLGNYAVTLYREPSAGEQRSIDDYCSGDCWFTGQFKVAEFRIPHMKGLIQPPAKPLINTAETELDVQVMHLSGGGAGNLPVLLRSMIDRREISFPDYEGFAFANGRVEEGRIDRQQDEESRRDIGKPRMLQSMEAKLDSAGTLRTRIQDIPTAAWPQTLTAELEFRDPAGEVQTISQTIPVWPSQIVLGMKRDSWSSAQNLKFTVAALDTAGKPLRKARVEVDLFKRIVYSHRKRLIGGFYAYENSVEIKKVGRIFEGATDRTGLVSAEVAAPAELSGEIILQAEAVDADGNRSTVRESMWLRGEGEWSFENADSDRIDVLPEKTRYEVDEKAKLQVRMPFRRATALVTVEREGVMDTFIEKLSGTDPVIKVPVKGNYGPNVFISVLCVRGRVADVQPTALVDLGKPAFKLGIAEIRVGRKGYELEVKVKPKKDTCRIREKVPVKIKVQRADGDDLPEGGEVAVSAVDEGLLELMPNKSWDLLEAMMKRRPYEVRTSTAQMQVVGKRHYGLKALPQGGGGGMQSTRELFDTLLLWQGRAVLDKHGEATIEIPLNDSLTSFRIVAVASAGSGFFGTGHASIRSTQDIMIHSGLPQVVRQEDSFMALFTLRNATKLTLELSVTAQAQAGAASLALAPASAKLGPGASTELTWHIDVPRDVDCLKWEVAAQDKSGEIHDAVRVTQKVVPAVPERVVQAKLSQLKGAQTLQLKQPDGALPGRGGVNVALQPRLADGLAGITHFMKNYPYTCMEQRVSRAIALRDDSLWQSAMEDLPSHLDNDGLVKYFASCQQGSDVLTAYIVSLADEAGRDIPPPLLERMERALDAFVQGRIIRNSSLATQDTAIRKLAAIEALARKGKASPRHLQSLNIQPALWPTSAVLDWINILRRMPAIQQRDSRLAEAQQILRSRLNLQASMLSFSTEGTDCMCWLMIACDVNAVRFVLTALDLQGWAQDMPRLLRGALARQRLGRWSTTVANAWGVLALEKFSKKFEKAPVTGTTMATLDDQRKQCRWADAPAGDSLMFTWPEKEAQLKLAHDGTGSPWVTVQSIAASRLTKPFSSGYTITKTCTPVSQKQPGLWQPGDVARVRLDLQAQADMTWVVVNDPIPCGATILGAGLGRDSQILTSGERADNRRAWPAFEERSFEAFRAYYEYVPKGNWAVEYTLRFNNEGLFQLPATRVEALYAPEMLGEIPNAPVEVLGAGQQSGMTAPAQH